MRILLVFISLLIVACSSAPTQPRMPDESHRIQINRDIPKEIQEVGNE